MIRRRLLTCLGAAAALAGAAGCYQKVVRDERFAGEPVISEPNRDPDLLDEIEQAQREREEREAKARRDRVRSGG